MKKVRVILSPEAEEVYNHLNQEAPKSKIENTILNAFNKKEMGVIGNTNGLLGTVRLF